MLNVDGLKISLSRGDSGSVTITFTGEDIPPDETIAMFVLQKTLDSEMPEFVKDVPVISAQATIPFFVEDTRDLPRGSYNWCLRLIYDNGDVYTPMNKPQEFEILPATGEPGDIDGE